MTTQTFRTNIKCDGCVAKVTAVLRCEKDIDNWNVDLLDPERTLTVNGSISHERVIDILKSIGYKAEKK